MISSNKKEAINPKEILTQSEIYFIYLLHFDRLLSQDDPLLISPANQDLILFEFVGTRAFRQTMTLELNLILANPDTLSESDMKSRNNLIIEYADQPNLIFQVAIHLAGSNKRLFLVDIDDSHQAYSKCEKALKTQSLINKLVSEGDLTTAISSHEQNVDLWASLNRDREQTVADQVLEIINNDPSPKKVAVVQGTIHAPTSQIVQNNSPLKTEVVNFSPDLPLEAKLWLKKASGSEISRIEYLQAFITQFLLLPGARQFYDLEDYNQQVMGEANQIATLLTAKQIEELLALYQSLYRSHLRQLMPRSPKNASYFKNSYTPFVYRSAIKELFQTVKFWTKK
jgi:hypothetical protein